jgi:hypothetical protein
VTGRSSSWPFAAFTVARNVTCVPNSNDGAAGEMDTDSTGVCCGATESLQATSTATSNADAIEANRDVTRYDM